MDRESYEVPRFQSPALRANGFRIEQATALRANSVTEIRFGVIPHIGFQVVPRPRLVANLTARSAHGQEAAQGFDSSQCLLEFLDQAIAFGLRGLALADVANNDAGLWAPFGTIENNGRELDGKRGAVSLFGDELSMGSAGSLPLRDQGGEPRIGSIEQSLPPGTPNFLQGASKNSAGRGIRVEDRAVWGG